MNNAPECRQELAQRLETAGCPVNRGGTDWLSAGDFNPASLDSSEFEMPGGKEAPLLTRIRALRADLGDEDGFVVWSIAAVYNELIELSGVREIPEATHQGSEEYHLSQAAPYSTMSNVEMRTFLNQMLAQLGGSVD